MKRRYLTCLIPLIGLIATPVLADHDRYHPQGKIEQRLDRQHWRIKQGVRSGELTRKEARSLRRQQRRISRLERRFSSDGWLDRGERHELRDKLDRASDRIYRLKHNDRYRGRAVDDRGSRRADRAGRNPSCKIHDRHAAEKHDSGPQWAVALSFGDLF